MKKADIFKNIEDANNPIRKLAIHVLEEMEDMTNIRLSGEEWYKKEDEITEWLAESIDRMIKEKRQAKTLKQSR